MNKVFALITFVIFSAAPSQADKTDHPVNGVQVKLTGEIVSLRCYLLDPARGHGPEHSKCAEASLRRGEPAGFLADGVLYVLLGASDPKIKPVLLASTREQVVLTGSIVNLEALLGFNVTGVQNLGQPVKASPPKKKESNKEGLKKE